MNLGIGNKKAFVVGATRGMGLAIAHELMRNDCQVICIGRNEEKLSDLRAMGAETLVADLHTQDGLYSVISEAERRRPDIVVHVNGGSIGIRSEMLPSSEWSKVWQANLGNAHDINRIVIPNMVNSGWGRIVHFSTNGVKLGTGNVPYISAKGAVEAYVRNMSRLYSSKGIVITAVAPGPIYTPGIFMYDQDEAWTRAFMEKYVPMKRWGNDEEVAGMVALLCSERASYMAGAIIPVDGGMR